MRKYINKGIAMSKANSIFFASKFKSFFWSSAPKKQFSSYFFPAWPSRMSYIGWQNLLKSHLWFLGKNKQFLLCKQSISQGQKTKSEMLSKHFVGINNKLNASKPANNENIKLELITIFKQFLERKNISQHIEEAIHDHRDENLIIYSKQSIIMCALSIFLFRMESGNRFDDKSHDNDEKYSKVNMAKFIGAPEDRVPVIKTIEKFLKNLEEERINDLMFAFFKDLQKSKFFMQHPQIMPGDFFLLAADCVHTHTYDHPHHIDKVGNNDCPCCLKRVYNKGTEKEKIRWLHYTLVFSFVFMGGLKIPVYRYPIHAKQIVNLESASEDFHKQECELVALKTTLPKIREMFPKMKIVLLLDGLYANKPVIRLATEQKCGYIIVKKDSSLPLLTKECDELSVQPNHKKNCTKRCLRSNQDSWLIEQRYEWFNNSYLGENIYTHVLRFCETRTKEGEATKCYKSEWLFSKRLSANTCELSATLARSRWEEEDIFNSLKNRGFNFQHDYSRDPRSCFNWQGLALFAFGIFELFRFCEAVRKRVDLPQITLAEKLQGQLLYRPTEEIFSEKHLSKRVQFRYHFVVELILYNKMSQDSSIEELKTG